MGAAVYPRHTAHGGKITAFSAPPELAAEPQPQNFDRAHRKPCHCCGARTLLVPLQVPYEGKSDPARTLSFIRNERLRERPHRCCAGDIKRERALKLRSSWLHIRYDTKHLNLARARRDEWPSLPTVGTGRTERVHLGTGRAERPCALKPHVHRIAFGCSQPRT